MRVSLGQQTQLLTSIPTVDPSNAEAVALANLNAGSVGTGSALDQAIENYSLTAAASGTAAANAAIVAAGGVAPPAGATAPNWLLIGGIVAGLMVFLMAVKK